MGNWLSTTRQNDLEKELVGSKNNLGLYLKDVFEKECEFKVSVEESKFIQSGIESIMQRIVNAVMEDENFRFDLNEFAKEADIRGRKVTHGPANIIKVGSFYEHTKNNFPDEFDFIFILGCIERQLYDKNKYYSLQFDIGGLLCDLRDQNLSVEFSDATLMQDALLFLDTDAMAMGFSNGPAFCLPFIYERLGVKRCITADLVPAWRVTDCSIAEHANKFCNLEPFREEILSTGSFLLISEGSVTFTETEVSFMRNKLSATHVTVYRLLKYLINGHGDGEELKQHLKSDDTPLSSYNIKTMMIYHHYTCTNSSEANTGFCILQVLNEMCKHETMESFPSICFNFRDKRKLCLKSHLEKLIEMLKRIKEQNDAYDYGKCKIEKSVSKEYIDDNNIDTQSSSSETQSSSSET